MIIQPIVNIPEICSRHGIRQTVISPGSRSAPITLAFARHPRINTFVIPDERSAGFIGLGLAQSSGNPVVSVCTSGTAVANLYPAVIEAFYQHVPLVIITADRPPELVDQQDGQTIRQERIFANHVIKSFQLPVSFDHDDAEWHAEKMISEAIVQATERGGPVHVNVPIREPFYPSSEEEYEFFTKVKTITASEVGFSNESAVLPDIPAEIRKYNKIMIVAGQGRVPKKMLSSLNELQKRKKIVVIGDSIANIHDLERAIRLHDLILKDAKEAENLAPDLLITFGESVLSKTLKNFLRKEQPVAHWHLGKGEKIVDTYKSLTKVLRTEVELFIQAMAEDARPPSKSQNRFFNHWTQKEVEAQGFVDDYFDKSSFSEFTAVHCIMQRLPSSSKLHLANSMPVRYANYFKSYKNKNVTIWSNRGTSGIDGCLSTAVGHTINTTSLNVLLIGDMAFFYDRNGLWHNHIPPNLRIIVLNNHGGGIFRMINGPKQLDELEVYFETRQKLNAANTARDFDLDYSLVKSARALPDILEDFLQPGGGPSLLEIETDPKANQKVYEQFNQKASRIWK